MSEKVELSTRGVKQIRSIVQEEFKPIINPLIQKTLESLLEKRAIPLLESMRYTVEKTIDKVVKEMYWSIMEEALKKADFQALFRAEIIKYLHERWASGSVPFDQQFDKALLKAVKTLASEKP